MKKEETRLEVDQKKMHVKKWIWQLYAAYSDIRIWEEESSSTERLKGCLEKVYNEFNDRLWKKCWDNMTLIQFQSPKLSVSQFVTSTLKQLQFKAED